MKIILLLLSLLFLNGCGNDDLPKVETLSSFRVLAIIADNPEVAAGGTSNLQLLVSDPGGSGRTISGTYRACVDPGISLGAEPSCVGVSGATSSTAFSIDFSNAGVFGSTYTGLDTTNTFNISVPATILSGASTIEQTNGRGYVVVFRFDIAGREFRAFKRIIVSNRGTKNSNPGSPTIRLNGGSLSSLPVVNDTLTIYNLSDEESFSAYFSNGVLTTQTESYNLAWYVSGAELDAAKVGENGTVKFVKAPASRPFTAIAVIRDERGGTSFQRINLN